MNTTAPQTKTVYIGAYGSEYMDRTPRFLKLDVTPEICAEILRVKNLVKDAKLNEARIDASGITWESEFYEDEVRLTSNDLVVSNGWFGYEAMEKHTDCVTYSRLLEIDAFIKAVNESSEQAILYMGDADGNLQQQVKDVENDVADAYQAGVLFAETEADIAEAEETFSDADEGDRANDFTAAMEASGGDVDRAFAIYEDSAKGKSDE